MRRPPLLLLLATLLGLIATPCHASPVDALKKHPKTPEQLRADYVARLQQQYVAAPDTSTVGSLWSAQGPLNDFSTDYKASRLNDTVNIVVSVQTAAAQSGTVDSERTFNTSSSLTGIFGRTPSAANPLFSGASASVLKGQGSTASNTTLTTSLTGQIIAVLPNGNLAVQAEREIYMNNQHENVIVRGLLRPGDIGPGNTVPSSALSNLEIEIKGKGIIADGVRPPGVWTRALMWLLNF